MLRGGGITLVATFAGAVAASGVLPTLAQTTCTRAEFEAVVGEAAQALRRLNAENRPVFQQRLRELKERRGWSQDKFLEAAAPIVQDERTEDMDRQSSELLARIQSMGAEGSSASQPDCAKLAELRGHMRALVDVQKSKWQHLFAKIAKELGS